MPAIAVFVVLSSCLHPFFLLAPPAGVKLALIGFVFPEPPTRYIFIIPYYKRVYIHLAFRKLALFLKNNLPARRDFPLILSRWD
jgi:hypothetical protein